jgi:hypothetical protein
MRGLEAVLAICKCAAMSTDKANPLVAQLRGIGVSSPYASQIASGNRKPSLALAIKIWRRLGVQLGPIEGKTGEQIETLARASELLKGAAE